MQHYVPTTTKTSLSTHSSVRLFLNVCPDKIKGGLVFRGLPFGPRKNNISVGNLCNSGFVSLAGGLVGNLWRVDGGNWVLPRRLAQHSGAVLKNSKVISIEKSGKGYTVTSESVKGGSTESEEFDVVVVATPLHDADIALPSDIVTG